MRGRRRDDQWDAAIYELMQRCPGWGATRVHRELEQLAIQQDKHAPSPRSVERTMKALRENPTWSREKFGPFLWPESIGPELPPASAVSAFELWRFLGRRPSLRLVRAFWYVSLALPGEELAYRYPLAVRLADANDEPTRLREIESDVLQRNLSTVSIRSAKFPPSNVGDSIAAWWTEGHGELDKADPLRAAFELMQSKIEASPKDGLR
jgi:hypothetical protein